MKTTIYKIGPVILKMNMPDDMKQPENLSKFQVQILNEEIDCSMEYFLDFVEDIAALEKELYEEKIAGKEAKRDTIHVFQTSQGECRRINFKGDPLPYAIALKNEKNTKVWYRSFYKEMLIYDTIFESPLALEKLMIDAEALILHSAYMNYQDTAVLFSAPSGTGKSTQADLWEKYRGTYTVNGDKSLLIREADGWYATGWPICGSSEICHNETYPVRAIVMLSQAKENNVYPLKGFRAVREVMEQITINAWDTEFQIKAMDKIDELLREVPVYKLECNISEEAVKCLEKMLV